MFGKNSIQSAVNDPELLAVQAVFDTIQGEGPFSGTPCVFIRLAGCNLACHFCDTEFESGLKNLMSIPALLAQVSQHRRKLVVITGGEPMRQNIGPLIEALLEQAGVDQVQIETAGTLWPEGFERVVHTGKVTLVCSPKTPKIHPMVEAWCFHYKYIIAAGEIDEHDGLPNRGTQIATMNKKQRLFRPQDSDLITIWCSPRDDSGFAPIHRNHQHSQAAVQSCLKHGYRLSLQVHKIVGLE